MVWMNRQAFWCFLPAVTDVLIRGEPSQGFESCAKVVGHEESLEMCRELLMSLLMVCLYRRFL